MQVEHGFLLQRVNASLRKEALSILDSLAEEMVSSAAQYAKLDKATGARFLALEKETNNVIQKAYGTLSKRHQGNLFELAKVEEAHARKLVNSGIGVDVFDKRINPKILEALAGGKIIDGSSAADWWQGQANNLKRRFSAEMSKGILLGESIGTLSKRIVGEDFKSKKGGIIKLSKTQAEMLVRTSVNAVSNEAALATFRELGTVKGIQWVSTLDTRTTVICVALDGKQWRIEDLAPVGHDKAYPGGNAHFGCRSARIAVTFSWEELSGKKIPAIDNKTLQARIDEKLKARGMKPDQIEAALANARASMDGQVSKKLDFEGWAESKGNDFVESVIGPGKFQLWNEGKMTMSDLTDQFNRPLTVAELKKSVDTGKPPPETLGQQFNSAPVALKEIQAATKEARAAVVDETALLIGEMAGLKQGDWTEAHWSLWQSIDANTRKKLAKQWGRPLALKP